jgi:hypothetical protein
VAATSAASDSDARRHRVVAQRLGGENINPGHLLNNRICTPLDDHLALNRASQLFCDTRQCEIRDDLHAGLEGNAVLFRVNKRIVRNPEYCSLAATRNGSSEFDFIEGRQKGRHPLSSQCVRALPGLIDLARGSQPGFMAAASSIASTLPIWEEYLTRVPMSPCLPRHAGELDLTWTCRKDRAE